ncbi:hypothetical protein EMCRGX_G021879 [Ephydatia muelleri]
MSGLDVKVILLFTLLGTALASRTLSKAEANSMTDYVEMQDEDLELTLQQDKAQLILTYAKIAEEHAELIQFRHEVMKMGLFCTPCKKVVGYLLDLAMSDKIKDIVKGELDTKCSSLSFVLKTGCSFVVDHFFDTLWKSIRDHRDTDAEILCQAGMQAQPSSLHLRSLVLCLQALAFQAADPLVAPTSFNVLELSRETLLSQKQLACQSSSWTPGCLLAGYVDYQLQTRDLPQVDHQAKPYDKTFLKALWHKTTSPPPLHITA